MSFVKRIKTDKGDKDKFELDSGGDSSPALSRKDTILKPGNMSITLTKKIIGSAKKGNLIAKYMKLIFTHLPADLTLEETIMEVKEKPSDISKEIREFISKCSGPQSDKERKERKILQSPWGSAYVVDADPTPHASFRCISLMHIEEEDLNRMNICDKFGLFSNDRMIPLCTITEDGIKSERVLLFAKVRNGK